MKDYMHKGLLVGLALGAAAGYAYYHFIGCNSGSCNITSNPLHSTLYGMLIGGVIAWKKKPANDSKQDDDASK